MNRLPILPFSEYHEHRQLYLLGAVHGMVYVVYTLDLLAWGPLGAVGAASGYKLNKNEGLYGKGVGRHEAWGDVLEYH